MPNSGQFKPGTHWRPHQPFWDREWLAAEYVEKNRPAAEIARQFGLHENAILYWLGKHAIPRRTTSEVRAGKHWGLSGATNGQFGKRDALNAQWKGGKGTRPQGRVEYRAWRAAVIARCGATCGICRRENLVGQTLAAHHLLAWKDYPSLRFKHWNGIVLCASCHTKLHAAIRKGGVSSGAE